MGVIGQGSRVFFFFTYSYSIIEYSFILQGNNDDVILSCCLHYCQENFVNRLATGERMRWSLSL